MLMTKKSFRILMIILIIITLVAIGLIVYPTISKIVTTQQAVDETESFDEQVQNIIDISNDGNTEDNLSEQTSKLFESAYNQGLIDSEGYAINSSGVRTSDYPVYFKQNLDRLYQDSIVYNNSLIKTQQEQLNENSYTNTAIKLSDYGIYNNQYGYVSAPSINLQLPIYLGANDNSMNYGAAHLCYTSLPIIDDSCNTTNTVLAAHTDYIGRVFFDNIKNLSIGDNVTVTNFWNTIHYKVISKGVYKPNDSKAIYLSEEENLLTLITCTNNGAERYIVVCKA
ncbi:MAG: class C sortase [Ruminococcus sp.]|nr:class C sortase [Ruminococcus sp.]